MSCGGALVDILLCAWPNEGLHFDLTLVGSREAYQLRGGFRPARSWWMEPLMVDGVATGPAEPATEQIWLRANHRVVITSYSIHYTKLYDLYRRSSRERVGWNSIGAYSTHH